MPHLWRGKVRFTSGPTYTHVTSMQWYFENNFYKIRPIYTHIRVMSWPAYSWVYGMIFTSNWLSRFQLGVHGVEVGGGSGSEVTGGGRDSRPRRLSYKSNTLLKLECLILVAVREEIQWGDKDRATRSLTDWSHHGWPADRLHVAHQLICPSAKIWWVNFDWQRACTTWRHIEKPVFHMS